MSNLVIEGLQFSNLAGNNLLFKDCENIIIRNCYFAESADEAISIENGKNFTIENNLFANNESGIYALRTKGEIVIRNNQFVNVKGPVPRGQYVQFDDCSGPGNIIENNKGESWPGESDPEDLVSVFKSGGTPESPIIIRNNIFRGGGPSTSGGGIMTGDTDGGYVIVENNILVDPGQYGIAIAGGKSIIIRNNKVFGRSQRFTNVGIYVWAQADVPCGEVEVSHNNVNFIKGNRDVAESNSYWDGENCGTIKGWETNKDNLTIEELNLPAHLIDFISPGELIMLRKSISTRK
jgi:parallel beta-helix repeat protein